MDMPHLTPTSDRARELEARGFSHQFALAAETVVDVSENTHYVPEQVEIVEEYREEGASNPEDESVLLALRAPDGVQGTLTTAYGREAPNADVLRRLGLDHRRGTPR